MNNYSFDASERPQVQAVVDALNKSPRIKYRQVVKDCPVCGRIFHTAEDSPREKTVCSYGCSNTYNRSGSSNPNYKDGSKTKYREYALLHKPNLCNRCGWDVSVKVLEVHHIDRDRSNNELQNLEVLCRNCHGLEHVGD